MEYDRLIGQRDKLQDRLRQINGEIDNVRAKSTAANDSLDRTKDEILRLDDDNRKREELLDSTNKSFSDLMVVLEEMKNHNAKMRDEFF
jgi:chromosome segregation ATPase